MTPATSLRSCLGRRFHLACAMLLVAAATLPMVAPGGEIGTAELIDEMADLEGLARWPDRGYRTVQFSSYDRRSTTSEAPGWFSNADGFGQEPIPGFLKVLREPRDGGPGLYLLAEASGPGAIVRGWSAGMGGVLRVQLDPSGEDDQQELVWSGDAYDFLARRSVKYLKEAGVELDAGDAFVQQDADYLPIPFARGLRVTWEGKLNELHFYHLQVRLYPPGTVVRTFDPRRDVKGAEAKLRKAAVGLTAPTVQTGQTLALEAGIEPGKNWAWSPPQQGPGAIRELRMQLKADDLTAALRSTLLRISFDGSQRPQVESPVGDFFGSGPGINPFSSLPCSVKKDGMLTCRFVMPYEKSVRVELINYSKGAVTLTGSIRISDWKWDERSLYFRAKWRADHDLLAGAGAVDLPYTLTIGRGVFVGCAAMIMNPSGVPTAGGNWWGEGDEKILVDGELRPSTFGTGSEDYFNYSWSRPALFDHPYCGQPLDSGPDTAGHVSNHRFQILDAIPFEKSIAVLMELWSHNRTPGLSYARIAYHYARPGAIDDHRALMPVDLVIPVLPAREPKALGGATGAKFFYAEQLQPAAPEGSLRTVALPIATRLRVDLWSAVQGGKLKLKLPVENEEKVAIHLVALHSQAGGSFKARLDGQPLTTESGTEVFSLKTDHAQRVLNVDFKPVTAKPGVGELVLECVEPGALGIDYLWVRKQ